MKPEAIIIISVVQNCTNIKFSFVREFSLNYGFGIKEGRNTFQARNCNVLTIGCYRESYGGVFIFIYIFVKKLSISYDTLDLEDVLEGGAHVLATTILPE